MKINIRVLGRAMFAGKANCLDLDTGEIVSMNLIGMHLMRHPRRSLGIPLHFPDEIYAPYIAMLRQCDPEAFAFMQKWYPELVELQSAYPDCDPRKYIDEAFHFTNDYDEILDCREAQSAVPTYAEYSAARERQAAEEWCRREGFEWYE